DDAVGAVNGLPELSEPNLRSLSDYREVLDAQAGAVLRFQECVFNVLDRPDEADLPHVDLLSALLGEAAAGVGVVVGQLLFDVGQAQPIRDQLFGIDANLILTRHPSE